MYNKKNLLLVGALFLLLFVSACGSAAPAPIEESRPQAAAEVPADVVVDDPTCSMKDLITINPPNSADPFGNKDAPVGYGWSLNSTDPASFHAPCGTFVWVAAGNVSINGEAYKAAEDEINIRYLLCLKPDGCPVDVSDLKAAHGYLGVTYAWMENPEDTLKGQIMSGFEGQNCGDGGCPNVKVGKINSNATTTLHDLGSFTGAAFFTLNDIQKLEREMKTAVVGPPPETSEVILVGDQPVGHVYNLAKGDTHVAVAEGVDHGTIVVCPMGCVVNGKSIAKGKAAVIYGPLGDHNTPSDNNTRVSVTSEDIESIQVWFVYGASVDDFIPDGLEYDVILK